MKFGEAVELMKSGEMMTREGWNGKNQFAYYVPGGNYPAQTDAIKQVFPDKVPYNPYFALKGVNDTVSTWVPSINDVLAEDWVVYACNAGSGK